MAGIGKSAIALVLITVLAVVLIGTLAMAKHDQTTDPICQSGTACNGTVALAEMAGTQTTNLLIPIVIVSGGMFLFAVLAFLRKSTL